MAKSRTMKAVGALACALLVANASPSTPPSHPDHAEDIGQVDELLFDRDRYERMTVPVTIEGKGPYRFLIDTGAQATAVTNRITKDLNLMPTGRALLVAMGSSQMVDTIELDGLEFANRRFSGLTAPLLEDQHVGADGILGLDSLQRMRVLIDFEEDSIAVADGSETSDRRGFEIVVRARRKLGQMIITGARVEGIRTAVVIDTGSQGSYGNPALQRRLRARRIKTMASTDVNGAELLSDVSYVRELRMGGLTLTHVPVGFAQSPVFEQLGLDERPAIILGMRNLRIFDRVAIDFFDRKVLFDLPRDASRRNDPHWTSRFNSF